MLFFNICNNPKSENLPISDEKPEVQRCKVTGPDLSISDRSGFYTQTWLALKPRIFPGHSSKSGLPQGAGHSVRPLGELWLLFQDSGPIVSWFPFPFTQRKIDATMSLGLEAGVVLACCSCSQTILPPFSIKCISCEFHISDWPTHHSSFVEALYSSPITLPDSSKILAPVSLSTQLILHDSVITTPSNMPSTLLPLFNFITLSWAKPQLWSSSPTKYLPRSHLLRLV